MPGRVWPGPGYKVILIGQGRGCKKGGPEVADLCYRVRIVYIVPENRKGHPGVQGSTGKLERKGELTMRKALYIIFAAAIVFALSGAAMAGGALPKPQSDVPEAQEKIDQAWEIYKTSDTAEGYKKAVELMKEADKLDPKNHMIKTDISRYYWNWGDELPKETEEQQDRLEEIYEKGLKYADQSLDIKETAGGHYWYAVNKAASKEFSSIFGQAAAFPSIYSHSEDVDKFDPDYYYGASGRLWSEVLTRVPKKVVEIVGWDVQEAIDDINTAIEKYPGYLDNYVYKARFYWVYFEDKETALELLDHALSKDPETLMPSEVNANKTAQADAKELWKDITGKEYPNK